MNMTAFSPGFFRQRGPNSDDWREERGHGQGSPCPALRRVTRARTEGEQEPKADGTGGIGCISVMSECDG
jgi:hypothetical protein